MHKRCTRNIAREFEILKIGCNSNFVFVGVLEPSSTGLTIGGVNNQMMILFAHKLLHNFTYILFLN